MGIYIKNMEMPKSCYHCVWMFRDKPKVYCTATETNPNIFAADQWLDVSDVLAENRHSNCPLVEIPPHGRLIDADALYEKFARLESEAMNALKTTNTGSVNWIKWSAILTERTGYKYDIADAPTVIEADKGGDA